MLQNVPSVGDIPAVEGVRHGLNESPFEIANNDPHPSFSVSDHRTENYQGICVVPPIFPLERDFNTDYLIFISANPLY